MEATKLGVSATEWEALRDRDDPLLHKRVELCRVLLDAGAHVNNVADSGFTALGLAVVTYNDPLARFLLERGANPNFGKLGEQTWAQMARKNKSARDVVERLTQAARAMPKDPPPRSVEPVAESVPAKEASLAKKAPRPKAPPQPAPDFAAALDRREYRDAIDDMERRCGSKAVPFEHLRGGFHFHVDSRSSFDFDKARKDLLARGCSVVWLDTLRHQQVALLPTTDQFEVVRAIGTAAPNSNLDNDDIVAWLRDLHAEQPFEITGVRDDVVEGEFLAPIKDTRAMAKRMYEFCSDIVTQGVGSVAALAKSLKGDRPKLYFWWD
jgi:hypothetical protein